MLVPEKTRYYLLRPLHTVYQEEAAGGVVTNRRARFHGRRVLHQRARLHRTHPTAASSTSSMIKFADEGARNRSSLGTAPVAGHATTHR